MSSLPFEVNYRAKKLISGSEDAVVRLDPAWGYRINERTFAGAVEPLLSEEYIAFGVQPPDDGVAYSGAESAPANPAGKKPNITVLKNWGNFLGTTMGHHQGVPELRCQEVYESHGFGAMVIDRDGEDRIGLHCMKPGDKVLIPSYCIMTLYNLDHDPLVTLDFANPALNKSSKSLQGTETGIFSGRMAHVGPVLCMHYDNNENLFYLSLNRLFVNRQDGHGVKLGRGNPERLWAAFPFDSVNMGPSVYDELLARKRRLACMGIDVVECSGTVSLEGMSLTGDLWNIAEDDAKPLHRYFRMM